MICKLTHLFQIFLLFLAQHHVHVDLMQFLAAVVYQELFVAVFLIRQRAFAEQE